MLGRGANKRGRFVIAAVGVFVAAMLAGLLASRDSGVGERQVAQRAVVSVEGLIADRPEEAALQALAGHRFDPSVATEMAMLGVAVDGAGVERVVRTGSSEVTAATRTERFLVTAGGDRHLRVWRVADGGLVGGTRTARPLTALASDDGVSLLAGIDSSGRVLLIDLTDPERPRLWPLAAALSPGEEALTLGFSGKATEVVAVGARGEVGRVDVTTGRLVSRESVLGWAGPLPWGSDGPIPTFAVARLAPEADAKEGLALVTAAGAVALVDLPARRGRTVLPPGLVPGRPNSVDFRGTLRAGSRFAT